MISTVRKKYTPLNLISTLRPKWFATRLWNFLSDRNVCKWLQLVEFQQRLALLRALYLWVNDGAIFFTRCFWCSHQSQKLQTGFKQRRNFVIFRMTKFWVKLIEIDWFFKFPNLIIVAITEIHQLSFESNLKFFHIYMLWIFLYFLLWDLLHP